jgi:hypothetical protein
MANVPSGISNLPSGTGNIRPGGSLPGILKVPPADYNFPAGISSPPNIGYAPGLASLARPKGQSNHSGQIDVTGALLQGLGAGSAFNPMAVFDLMNLPAAARAAVWRQWRGGVSAGGAECGDASRRPRDYWRARADSAQRRQGRDGMTQFSQRRTESGVGRK